MSIETIRAWRAAGTCADSGRRVSAAETHPSAAVADRCRTRSAGEHALGMRGPGTPGRRIRRIRARPRGAWVEARSREGAPCQPPPRAARRRRSSGTRCSGRGCPRAPRGSRRRSDPGGARAGRRSRRRARACRSRTARHPPRRTPPAHGAARRLGQPLDRHHLVAVGLRGEDEARADEPAVEQHRAGSALALLAGVLRPGQPEPLAQREEQALAGPHVGLAPLAVDRQLDPHAAGTARAHAPGEHAERVRR